MLPSPISRRDALALGLKAGTLAAVGDLAFLKNLPPVSAAEANVSPRVVQFTPEMEPLVRLIEETPRGKLLEAAAARIHEGTSYGRLLAALLLAGVRSIKPRPVGYQFHAVLVVNSAHLASLAAPDTDRWLPLFWALDNFKGSQARNRAENGGWMMPPVEEGKLPPPTQAKRRFVEAMDNWDEEGADRAIAQLVRNAGMTEVIEIFWRYGCRDFRDIGHKAIFAANSFRALQTIGWRHAEPVMRSLAFAMLDHRGTPGNPAQGNHEADVPGRENLKRLAKIRGDWQRGKIMPRASADLLATLRQANPSEASEKVVELLNKGVDPAFVWDGLFLTAGELLMRQPGIGGLHTVTTMNALHYAYTASGDDETRRLLMLQGAAFLPLFRKFMEGRDKLPENPRIDTLEKADLKATGPAAVEEILADVGKDRLSAAQKTLALLERREAGPEGLMTGARRLIFLKGTDSHDYKFSSAALEDYYHATRPWRNRYLAASTYWLKGSREPDNQLIGRARGALG
jgi:hypothetical protein